MYKLFSKKAWSKSSTLVKRIFSLLLIAVPTFFIVRWCTSDSSGSRFEIDKTPLRIEMIRSIAELATISFKNEVVVDSIEYYKSTEELISGSLQKLIDPKDFKYGIKPSNIKRRLSLIILGELRIGFDLKKQQLRVIENDSLIQIYAPKPEILDVLVTPSTTEVFQENGTWKDYEIRSLQNKARMKLKSEVKHLDLFTKAKENFKTLIYNNLILSSKKKIELFFE
jgi:hypothetical protein